MDNTELLKLSLSKGGIGNATFDYEESPSTQTYTQNASQQLNAGYNQMLADIHRMGDVNTAKFNMDLKALNAGLENQYKEELKEKEFNNELKKLRFTHDLTMKKYEKARQDQLADRDWQINFQRQEEERNYRRSLPYFMDTGKDKPINRKQILQDPSTGRYTLYTSNSFPVLELPGELQKEYYEFSRSINRGSIGEYDPALTNEFKNYLVNKYNTIDDAQKLNVLLQYVDAAKQKYFNKLPESPYEEYIHYGADTTDPTRNLNSPSDPSIKYLGEGNYGNPISQFMYGLMANGNLAAQNYIKQNGLMIADTNSQRNPDASELASEINKTRPDILKNLYNFVNINGMEDKIILTNPKKPQIYYLYEKGSNNVYAFYLSHYTKDGDPYFEPLGPIGFESLDRSKNNYEDMDLYDKASLMIHDGMYNLGAGLRKYLTKNQKEADPNTKKVLFKYKDKEYTEDDLKESIKNHEKYNELLKLYENLIKSE